jgi:hypothetical protein
MDTIPGNGVPVCVLKGSLTKHSAKPLEGQGGCVPSSSFDSQAVIYGRLIYRKIQTGLRSAAVVVSARDEDGVQVALHGKRFSQNSVSYHCSKKGGSSKVAVQLIQLTLSNFLRLAARRAGFDSMTEESIVSSSRIRTMILLCNSLESVHEFEQLNAKPLRVNPKIHSQETCAITASKLPIKPIISSPDVAYNVHKGDCDRSGKLSSYAQETPDHESTPSAEDQDFMKSKVRLAGKV